MEFGKGNCVLLLMMKNIIVKNVNTGLPDGKVIKILQKGQSCEYLQILEADRILVEEMKMR